MLRIDIGKGSIAVIFVRMFDGQQEPVARETMARIVFDSIPLRAGRFMWRFSIP